MPKINEKLMQQNRQTIIESAKQLFNIYGYNSTSVNDIIKRANISKGKFYTYFDSKVDLFFCIINEVDKKIMYYGKDLLSSAHSQNPLSDYIEYRLRRFVENENRIRAKYTLEFFTSVTLSESQQQMYDTRYGEFSKDIKSIITYGQNIKLYKNDANVDPYIHVLMSCIDGLITLDTVLNQHINDEVIKTTIDIFTKYMKE